MNLTTKYTNIIHAWPQWSPAERRHMDEITEEILTYCRSGIGNKFIAEWCKRVLTPQLEVLRIRNL